MRKKRVLVHGTADSLKKFFADALSFDYEIVAILSESFEKISIVRGGKDLEVFPSQSLPKIVFRFVDAIIITDVTGAKESVVRFFIKQGFPLRKIILWNNRDGWESFEFQHPDGTRLAFIGGLEFHINDKDDENFYNGIKNQLKVQRVRRNMEPEEYPKLVATDFEQRRGKPLDFNNVQTFTEKLNWIKVFDATPLKSRLADKYAVRGWIADKIGSQYLIPLLGVWNDFDEINFNELPNQFVLKCNHSWNANIIVRDKNNFDKQKAREQINAWLNIDHAARSFELHYTRIQRRILAEKFMSNGDLPNLIDYRFWCFNGKPFICGFDDGSIAQPTDFFDMNWKVTDIEKRDYPNSEHPEQIPPPKNFELMKNLAAKLAEGFAFVRVDFYEIEGKVYFSEMTFTPGAANFSYKSAGTDEQLGGLLKLPKKYPMPHL